MVDVPMYDFWFPTYFLEHVALCSDRLQLLFHFKIKMSIPEKLSGVFVQHDCFRDVNFKRTQQWVR